MKTDMDMPISVLRDNLEVLDMVLKDRKKLRVTRKNADAFIVAPEAYIDGLFLRIKQLEEQVPRRSISCWQKHVVLECDCPACCTRPGANN